MEPVRYPIEPLSSEEDSSDNISESPDNADAGEKTSGISVQCDETSGPSMHEVVNLGDDAMTLPKVEVAGCFSADGFPGEGTLGLEQLFAVTQLELEDHIGEGRGNHLTCTGGISGRLSGRLLAGLAAGFWQA
jgi:hypothetical protein